MRRLGAGRLAALLVPVLAVSVAPAQAQTYKPEPTMQGNLWDSLFGSSPAQPEVKDVSDEPPQMSIATDRALQHDRLMRVYLRRSKVCLQLQAIALETNDAALDAEAQRLEAMAFTIYLTRSRQLLGTGFVPGAEELEAGNPVRATAPPP